MFGLACEVKFETTGVKEKPVACEADSRLSAMGQVWLVKHLC